METGKGVGDNWSSPTAAMCHQQRPSATVFAAKHRRYKATYGHGCPADSCEKHKVAAVQKGELNFPLGMLNVAAEAMHESPRDIKLSRRP